MNGRQSCERKTKVEGNGDEKIECGRKGWRGTKAPDLVSSAMTSEPLDLRLGPEKRHIPHKVVDSGNGVFRIEFTTVEVGSYVIDVTVSGKHNHSLYRNT